MDIDAAFGITEPEDPYQQQSSMATVNPASNPYGQGGGMRGRLRDALLAAGSAGHDPNRLQRVMQARMYDRGMAQPQLDYRQDQRADQQFRNDQAEKQRQRQILKAGYIRYAKDEQLAGKTPMAAREWLSMSEKDRSSLTLNSTSYGNPYRTVSEAGMFNGSQADFEALSAGDQSSLIMEATVGKNVQTGWMSKEDMMKEYDMSKFPPEKVKAALKFGDPILLGPPNAVNGMTTESIAREEDSRVKYRKEMTPLWTLQEGHATLVTALERGDGAGDIAAIFQFMKNLDPNSTVREGEFQLAAQVAGLKENALNLFDKYSEGDTLPVEARRQLADFSRQIVELSKSRRDQLREDYKYRIGRYKMDQKAVMGSRNPYDYDNVPAYDMTDTVQPAVEPGSVGEMLERLEAWYGEIVN